METKYGNYPKKQVNTHKDTLHADVFRLLWMKEENYDKLQDYFSSVLWKLNGYNKIFGEPKEIIDIISILEQARMEAQKEDYSHPKYRKAILDCMSLINDLHEKDGETGV